MKKRKELSGNDFYIDEIEQTNKTLDNIHDMKFPNFPKAPTAWRISLIKYRQHLKRLLKIK
jgi:hypothetical protein